jgi:uncharacterized protein (DUF1015 family)
VPRFLPFPGIRYRDRDISAVSAPPYDVIEPEARAALEARDPHNAVRLILPDSYEGAAADWAQWRDDGVLVTDDAPTFSIYRMEFIGDDGVPQRTTGVLGALALDDDGSGVMPHERTLPKAKSDRLELLRATRANLDPIWGLSLAGGLSGLLEPGPVEPDAVATDEDGFHHALWRVDDPERIAAISAAVGSELVVLADGHHRFETANNYRRERRAAGLDDPGADAIMTLIVELAPTQLCVRAIHRLLTGVAASEGGGSDLRAALSGPFFVHAAGPNVPEGVAALEVAMRDGDSLGLVDREGLALLMPTAELEQRVAAYPPELRDVDSARFDAGVLPAVPDVTLAYRNDAQTVAAQVEKGAADAAILLRPVSVDAIRAAAAADLRMPEKTTFFAPKPRTGMVFRSLDVLAGPDR